MRYSSTAQMALDFGPIDGRILSPGVSVASGLSAGASVSLAPGSTAAPLDLPTFNKYDAAYAATSRIAGRINAANISAAEQDALFRERQRLLDKKLSGTITRRESNRLQYVRWTLDRIEDAKHGPAMDALEGMVAKYEQFIGEMKILTTQLQGRLPRKERP